MVPVLLHHNDVFPLQLSETGSVSALMGDHSTTSKICLLQPVEVTLTFTDGTTVVGVMTAGYFPPPEHSNVATVMTEDERILGYDALKILGLQQDYKAHRSIRALRRL